MPCDAKTFIGVDGPTHFRLLSLAAEKGYTFTDETCGQLKADGCTFAWSWNADKQMLTVTCTGKPFFVSCETVNRHIVELVHSAMQAP